MTNTQLLDDRIKQSGLKKGFIIDVLGLSRQGFHKKQNNITPFRAPEIYVLCDLLRLSDDDKKAIFYANEVDVYTNNEVI